MACLCVHYRPVIFPVTFYGGFVKILSSAYVWFMMIGMTVLALIPDIVWRAYVDISSESLAFARGAKKVRQQFNRDSCVVHFVVCSDWLAWCPIKSCQID